MELRDPSGAVVDSEQEPSERDVYRIHRILDLSVVAFAIDAPRSFTLVFEPAFRLTVFDDSEQYESFSIHVDGRDIYV